MQRENSQGILYHEGLYEDVQSKDQNIPNGSNDIRPFGSAKGKTYTFSWCQGSTRISSKNKIYFGSEEEAKGVGRRLSKLCKK
jgi:hypothetical protein